MTTAANTLLFEPVPTQRPEAQVKRDRWKRYVIPHPETGKEVAWTRATTVAGTLADRFGLEQWSKRNVVLGIGARRDLYAQAAAATPEDKQTLNQIVRDAESAAAADAGANTGSALHRFTERLDAGEVVDPPDPWDKDVAAYRAAMEAHGVTVVPGWLERILLVPEIEVAGTADRLCTAPGWLGPRIGDLKTAKDVLQYSMVEIALQLAIYAHATHWYDPVTGQVHKITETIDRHRALVMHLPVGQAICKLYTVDIAAGWDAVRLAVDVRAWRKRKDLAELMVPVELTAPEPAPVDPEPAPKTDRWESLPSNRLDLSEFTTTPAISAVEPTPSGGSGGEVDQGAPEATEEEGDPPAAEGAPALTITRGSLTFVVDEGLWDERLAWLRGRVETIKTAHVKFTAKAANEGKEGPIDSLARWWSIKGPDVPTFKVGGPRNLDEFEAVVDMCGEVEGEFGITFPGEEPGVVRITEKMREAGMVG